MQKNKKTRKELQLEVKKLKASLTEAEETLRAIRNGEVDAMVVSTSDGDQVFSLKGAERPYRILMEKIKEGAVTLAEDDTIFYCNQGFADMLKRPLEKMIGTGISQFVSPADKPVFEELLRQGRESESTGEVSFLAGDGTSLYANLSINAGHLDRLPVVYMVATDITKRKQAEEAVKTERQRFNEILDTLPAYLVLLTPDYHVPFANRFFEDRFGKSHGKRCFEYLFGRTEPCETCETFTCLKTMEPHEWEWTGPDGRNYYIHDFPFTDTDGSTLILETGIDITEQKQMHEKMREQAALLDNARDAILVRDLENRIIYWNKGAEEQYGWKAGEVIGKKASELLYKNASFFSESAQKSVMENGEWAGEQSHITKNGNEIIVESHWTLMRDSRGNPKSIFSINTNVTEKRRLEAQFLRAQRLESVGTLAGGLAHDLNNVLTPIMLSMQILKEKHKDAESQNLLDILEGNTQRGADLIKQVLSFARGVGGERKVIQAADVMYELVKIVKETFPRSIQVEIDVPEDLWKISGDTTQLHQVLMNMCINSRDAMPNGGTLSISAENVYIDENSIRLNIYAKIGSYIAISVSDTGTGLSPEVMDRVFEPFFTTKEHGKGTGLGLSTALAIVKSHDGFINVYNEALRGATFKVYLPADATVETQSAEEKQLDLPRGNGELILVVDDEVSILEITSATLKANGYSVITAYDGAEAVALVAQSKEEIRVVLMDMMMPVMSGPDSIRVLKKLNPAVKVIAVSGLLENGKIARIKESGIEAFLFKPYTAEKLLKIICRVLSK